MNRPDTLSARTPFLSLALCLVLLAPWPAAAQGTPSEEARRGQALALEVRTQRPAGPTSSKGTLRMRTTDGRRVTIPIEVSAEMSTNTWQTHYSARFSDGRREALTVINSPLEGPPRFVLRRESRDGRTAELRPERPDQLFASFAGTDFWLIDLGMTFLHWPDQRWLGRENRRTRVCDVLESRNPAPAPGAYRRVVTWIDSETSGIVRAEAYDSQNRLLKEFSPGSFVRVGSRYELRDMEIRNEQTDSRTTLIFEVSEPEKLDVKHLQGSR